MFVEFEAYQLNRGVSPETIADWKHKKLTSIWKAEMDWMRHQEMIFLLEAEEYAYEKGLKLNPRELTRIRLAKKQLDQLTPES